MQTVEHFTGIWRVFENLRAWKEKGGHYVKADLRSVTSKPHAWPLLRAWFKLPSKRKHKKTHGNKFCTRYCVRSKDLVAQVREWYSVNKNVTLKNGSPVKIPLSFQRATVWFTAPMWSGLQAPVPPVSGDWSPSSGLSTWAHVHRTHGRGINNKYFKNK